MIRSDKQHTKVKRRINKLEIFRKQARQFIGVVMEEDPVPPSLHELTTEIETLKKASQFYKANSFNCGERPDISKLTGIGQNLILARMYLGWSKSELGRRVKISRQQVERYESEQYEQASLARVRAVADELLVGYDEHQEWLGEVEKLKEEMLSRI